jgi:hypothetical protein
MQPATAPPAPHDTWTVRSLIAASAVMALVAMVIFWPTWPITWIAMAGAATFALMLSHHPVHWRRRMAGYMLTAAVGLSVPPMFKAEGVLKDVGWISIAVDSSPWIAVALVAGAVLTIAIEAKSQPGSPHSHAVEDKSSAEARDRAPASQLPNPQPPGPQPSFTGVVQVPVDGRVWRARLLAGQAIDAKPFCPRHGVELKPRSDGNNWHCTQLSCDYRLYMPSLAILAPPADKAEFLGHVYTQIERRVREGNGYVVCPDEASLQI